MRKYPYKLDQAHIQENLDSARRLVADLQPEARKAKAERNAMFFKVYGKELLGLGGYSYLFCEPLSVVLGHMREAHQCFALAIAFDVVMDPYEYIDYLSLSVALHDAKQAKHLASFPRSRYANRDVEAGEIVFALAESLACLVLGSEGLSGHLAIVRKNLVSKKILPYDKMMSESLLAILESIDKLDQTAFDRAVSLRRCHYAQLCATPNHRYLPDSFIDLRGLAVMRIALEKNLRCGDPGVHLPVDLLAV